MRYYIKDSTINRVVYFNTVNEVVSYFDQLIPRAHNVSRANYVQHLVDLGHGNDSNGVTLTRVLSEQFDIGIERKNGKLERTDIHAASRFTDEGYGD
jgi:hypothetical protein